MVGVHSCCVMLINVDDASYFTNELILLQNGFLLLLLHQFFADQENNVKSNQLIKDPFAAQLLILIPSLLYFVSTKKEKCSKVLKISLKK